MILTQLFESLDKHRLQIGDPIVVTGPNEFEGKTGDIDQFSPSGAFVVVNLYNHGRHSMHLSDVEYNEYADEQDVDEFWDEKEVDEGWSDAMVARRTGQPRTPYSVYIKGKKWKDFENDDHARAVMDKLKAKFKADGRDPSVITIAPTDIPEGVAEESQNDRNARIIAGEIEDAMSQGNEKVAQEKIKELKKLGYYFDKQGRLQAMGMYEADVDEAKATKTRLDPKCWTGKKIGNPKTKVKGGVRVNNCVPAESVEETKTLSKRVRVVKTGETGTIRQIKSGAFKGAPKTYYVDLDNGGQADNLPATALRLIKTQEGRHEVDEVSKDTLGRYIKLAGVDAADRASSSSYRSGAAGDKYNKADPSRQEVSRERGIDRAIKKLTK
jgi:hypothetical protein